MRGYNPNNLRGSLGAAPLANLPMKTNWFRLIAPGLMMAATGVGAGDLMTGTLAGTELGTAVLWAVLAGAFLKFVLSEGVARWQLASGTTLLAGWNDKLGSWVRWIFLTYLTLFTVVVGRALANACGVAATALYPIGEAERSVVIWAVIHSLVGVAIVLRGSFRIFESIMSLLIGVMFVTVVGTTWLIAPPISEILGGLVPSVPESGISWVVGLLGGVGGTVTLLSYGYWIQEQERRGPGMLRTCRIDLAVGNGITAVFGFCVVIIGSQIDVVGSGAALATQMAERLVQAVGPAGRWVFLVGFWGAVFSSLLGVWQSIPYMFADFVRLRKPFDVDLRQSTPYRLWVLLVAIVPLFLLNAPVRQIQLTYGVLGAMFLPLLALTLLLLNNRGKWVGQECRNPLWVNIALGACLVFFAALPLLDG